MIVCANCSSRVDSSDSHRVQCDSCKQYLHIRCTDLPSDDRVTRNKMKSMKIVCNKCSMKFDQLTDIKALIESLKVDFDKKVSSLREELSNMNAKIDNLNQIDSSGIVEAAVNESVDRIRRSKNIILRGIPTPEGTPAERKQTDTETVAAVLRAVDSTVVPRQIIRLGQRSIGTRPPIIKVVLEDEYHAKTILRKKNKLLQHAEFRSVRITDDKTPLQQRYLNYLREELQRRMSAGEDDLTIKYVRGSPQIVNCSQKN